MGNFRDDIKGRAEFETSCVLERFAREHQSLKPETSRETRRIDKRGGPDHHMRRSEDLHAALPGGFGQ
jgi:hypothetical protein